MTIEDLKVALPEAEAQLAIAERSAASAHNQLTRFNAEVLMRQRIDVAAQFCQAIAEAARLYGIYEKLGREIVSVDVMPRTMHGTSDYESAIGAKRVRASLPPFFWKLFPGAIHDEMKTESLAVTEARYWNLAPEQPAKAA
jgi:hypothetical protein